ncbi:DNA segregation protein PrgO [Liquorilactobacillus vini]|jgi:hypothetical protein|uniref:DNA segregation protein PrgO n=1 Tax=Liquorilactobacillus vini TaxID=238015 RepID=UPI0002FBC83E|nr:DNA segregation protein PrgO [Liquorilactobacillus vini]
MALLNNPKNNKKPSAKDIKIDDDVKINYGDKVYKARDRKPVQVDPPVLKMIRSISYAKDMPMYDVVKVAMQAYLNTLSENERLLYDRRSRKIY